MTVGSDRQCVLGTELNTVQLSIFSHRFMSIAGTREVSAEPAPRHGGTVTFVGGFFFTQNRWAEFSRELQSPPTLRSASTSPAPCSGQTGDWFPMLLTSRSTWEPCKRQSSTRCVLRRTTKTLATQKRRFHYYYCFYYFPVQIKSLGDKLKEGDVILSNHPCAGGSHLPDLTVITPVTDQISAPPPLPPPYLPLTCLCASLRRCSRKG